MPDLLIFIWRSSVSNYTKKKTLGIFINAHFMRLLFNLFSVSFHNHIMVKTITCLYITAPPPVLCGAIVGAVPPPVSYISPSHLQREIGNTSIHSSEWIWLYPVLFSNIHLSPITSSYIQLYPTVSSHILAPVTCKGEIFSYIQLNLVI